MEFKSEIRDSEKTKLTEKVKKRNYKNYLLSIKMNKLRGFSDELIIFDFPVTAIIGPNGGGKSTVIGAAACLYRDLKPGRFFSKSGRFDDSMQNWKIEYEVIDKEKNPTKPIKYSTTYGSYKWSRDSVTRPVSFFGVARTIPATERVELKKVTNSGFIFKDSQIQVLPENVAKQVGHILGKKVDGFMSAKVDSKGNITFLAGKTEQDEEYSEFHFGAGESSIIKMVTSIETLPDFSLVLIEEIENGLHPIATRRLVEYLIETSNRKNMQFIFTTHSNDALLPLPNDAIWSAINKKLVQGKLDILALRTITGQIDKKLAIFTEDTFSKLWIDNIVRSFGGLNHDLIEVHGLEGDGTAVKIHINHNSDPSMAFKSICYIDGDSQQSESDSKLIFRLPGQSPERFVFDHIMDRIDEFIGELTVSLHLDFSKQETVKNTLKDINLSNRDEHIIFIQIGEKLGFISENIVQNAFLSIWCRKFNAEANCIWSKISEQIV